MKKQTVKKQGIITQLKNAFPQFSWTKRDGGYFGAITVPTVNRVIDKNRCALSNVYIYISSQMTPESSPSFRYAICYQTAEVTEYRRRNSYVRELCKVYVSAPDEQGIVDRLIKEVDMSKYILS